MKLIRFTTARSPIPQFGLVIRDQAVAFTVLLAKTGRDLPFLADSRAYLARLPESGGVAKELEAWGEHHLRELGDDERFPLDSVRLLEPVEVAALYDFGLTPRHLKNSADVTMKYEKDTRFATTPPCASCTVAVMRKRLVRTGSRREPSPPIVSSTQRTTGHNPRTPCRFRQRSPTRLARPSRLLSPPQSGDRSAHFGAA
jgi:hypothetical protein